MTLLSRLAAGVYFSSDNTEGPNHIDIKLTGVPDVEVHFVLFNAGSAPGECSIKSIPIQYNKLAEQFCDFFREATLR